MKPVRIQRKRTKGYNMQEDSKAVNGLDCVYVGRPTMWGNPFNIGAEVINLSVKKGENPLIKVDHAEAAKMFKNSLVALKKVDATLYDRIQQNLSGLNLACFCRLDQPCHADILLEIANET